MVFVIRIAFVFLLIFYCSDYAFADQCNCDNSAIKNKDFYMFQLKNSDAVFVGRLEEKMYFTDGEYLASFSVDDLIKFNGKQYKKDEFDSIKIIDPNVEIIESPLLSDKKKKILIKIIGSEYEDECFFPFDSFRKYIVFAKSFGEGLLFVDICGGTGFFDDKIYSFFSRDDGGEKSSNEKNVD